MPAELPPEVRALFGARNMAHLATVMPDGTPQASPVWMAVEDGRLAVFTQERNAKARNMRRDPRVAISICDEVNPYRGAAIRGSVVEEVHGDAALAIMDRMSNRYVGSDFPFRHGVAFLIEPEVVHFQDDGALPFTHPRPD